MKKNNILLLAAAALLPLAGCLKDPGPSEGGAITIEASIGAQTKVTTVGDGSTFAEGDKIAVYAWTGSAGAVPDTRVVDGVVNTLGSSGWTPASEMRWKNLTDAHYFLGVSPVHTISDFSAGEYALGTESYAAGDLLVATVLGEGRKSSGGAVPLGFKHVMARLSVNIQLGNTLSAGDVSGVTVLAKKLAVVDYLAQTASASSSASASELPLFAMSTAASGYAFSYSGPQVPQEGVRKITVRVAGMDYVYTSDSDIPLVSGKHTTVNLVVGKDRVELSGVSVSDWDTGVDFPAGEARVVSPFFANNWLTFTSTGTTRLSLLNVGGNAPKLYYSTNTYDWTEWDYSELTFSSSAPLYLCGDNPDGFSFNLEKHSRFIEGNGSDKYSVSGDIMSLINKDAECKVIPNAYCYYELFFDCVNLIQAPDLPATELADWCYVCMFESCENLTTAPALRASVLKDGCYVNMFYNCISLESVRCLAKEFASGLQSFSECLNDWLANTKLTGTLIKDPSADWWENYVPAGWTILDNISASQYLTFTSSGTSTISLSLTYVSSPKLYYSRNAEDWYEWDLSGLTFTYGEPLYLCGDNPGGLCTHYFTFCRFHDEGSDAYEISGSIMSLLNKDAELLVIPNDYCFYSLFQGCTSLTTAPDLPATTLTPDCYGCLFNGCASLKTAPALPATALAAECYFSIFKDCISLSKAPDLPATTLANSCYRNMFAGCTGLTTARRLPATTLAASCYSNMFERCTGLKTMPELPATTLAESCYSNMFLGCTSLTTALELPATTLAESCYGFMFSGCTSLTTAPELRATTMTNSCYQQMFSGCTSLTTAPELPATTLATDCYRKMFAGCSNLSYVKCLATSFAANSCNDWLNGVAASGTFVKNKNATWSEGASGIPSGWTTQDIIVASRYLTFTSEGTSKISLSNDGGNAPKLYYSTNRYDWTEWDYSELTFSSGAPLYLRGDNPNGFSHGSKYSTFEAEGDNFSVSGDIMSLIDKDAECKVIPNIYCFSHLFQGCKRLTQAPELPATTLADCCYWSMFSGCTSLKTAPSLPATTLAVSCYYLMFSGCTGLTEAPKQLPATTLARDCYNNMFFQCTGLTRAPELPATTLADGCYYNMFFDCTGLTEAPEQLPATTLAKKCYYGMFSGCTGLTAAPELPATALVDSCYEEMFMGCKKLSYIKCLALVTGDTTDTRNWLKFVASNGTFVKNKDATWYDGANGIPSGWNVQDAN